MDRLAVTQIIEHHLHRADHGLDNHRRLCCDYGRAFECHIHRFRHPLHRLGRWITPCISAFTTESARREVTLTNQAIHHSFHGVGSSLFLCALTTALGFFAFIPDRLCGRIRTGHYLGRRYLYRFDNLTNSFARLVLRVAGPITLNPYIPKLTPKFLITFPFRHSTAIRIVSILLGIRCMRSPDQAVVRFQSGQPA